MTVSAEEPGSSGDSRRGRRRRWTEEEKRRIVAESEAPGSSVSIVARRHDLNANMLFTWRREFRQGEAGASVDQAAFVPAVIAPEEADGQPATTLREHRASIKDDSARRPPGPLLRGHPSILSLLRALETLNRGHPEKPEVAAPLISVNHAQPHQGD